MPRDGAGSFETVMDELMVIAGKLQEQHPELHTYRWWQPDMKLPCLYHWLTPSSTSRADLATEVDVARITAAIAVLPAATVALDAKRLEALFDDAADLYADELLSRNRPLGQKRAKRTGLQMVSDKWGDTDVLLLELQIEAHLDRHIPNT